ncbi:MAG TPA: flagellin [Bryobacteraceae bacterium]|jgi:flagellin|nr:flagellin [Bryobacteraceae bacterium]
MSLSFQTNIESLQAQQNLQINTNSLDNAITQLTSGYRINDSGDDPGGLAVANGLRADVTELQQGVSNANDGSAILQTIDGGLNNISNILDQLQQLATQSASGTFSGSRSTLNEEFQTLLGEINRQAANIGLASGGGGTTASQYNNVIDVYIGGGSSQTNSQVVINLSGSANIVDSGGLGISTAAVDTAAHAQTAITDINSAVQALGLVQGSVGDGENDLNYAIGLANSQITNESAAESDIRDANVAQEAAALTQGQVLQQSSVAALAQANAEPEALLKLFS